MQLRKVANVKNARGENLWAKIERIWAKIGRFWAKIAFC